MDFMNFLRIADWTSRLCVALVLMLATTAHALCSSNSGKVVFNEVQDPSSGTTYLELRVLDPTVMAGNFAGWKVDVYKNGSKTSADLNAIFTNTTLNNCGSNSAWIRIPDSALSNFIHGSGGADKLNFVLWETASSQIVDVLRWGNVATLYTPGTSYSSCPTIEGVLPSAKYDAPFGSNGNKDWYRTPDGTGNWGASQTANNANSICGGNDINAPAQLGLNKVASASVVAPNTNFSYTLYAQNPLTGATQTNAVVSDNLSAAGLTFVSCVATAPDTCTYSAGTGLLTWTVGTATNPLNTNTTRTAVLTVKATSTGALTNTITANTAGTPTANTSITVANVPSVTTTAATAVGATGATLNGTVTSNGATTTVTFEYGTSSGSYTTTGLAATPSTVSGTSNVNVVLTTLNCGTTYYFRAKGVNAAGTSYGGELSFSTSACTAGFTAYEAYVSNASAATTANRVIQTRVASTSGNLCKANGSTCNLTVAAMAAGAVNTAYSGTVSAKLQYCSNVSRTGTGSSSTVACGGSWSDLTSAQSITLAAGVGTATFGFINNAYEVVRVSISSVTVSGGPWSSDDYFAIRPTALQLSASDATSSTAGSTNSLTSLANIHRAGTPFTLNAQAYVGTSATTASNYRGTGAGPVVVTAATTVTGTGAVRGPLNPGTWSGSGTLGSTTATYSEVGSVTVTLQDQDYANVDLNDGSTAADRYVSGSATLGRFTPDHFDTVVSQGCSSFTYSGQSMQATVTARNRAGATTLNYDGSANTSPNQAKVVSFSDANGAAGSFTAGASLAVSAFTAGVASASPAFTFTSKTTSPATLLLRATDTDGISSATGNDGTPASAVEGGSTLRSGRLRLLNAYGSELLPMRVPVRAEYYNAGGWALNTADTCTTLTKDAVALGNRNPSAMGSSELSVVVVPMGASSPGVATLILAKPALAGVLDVALDLGTGASTLVASSACLPAWSNGPNSTTGAGLAYLEGNWCGASADRMPLARVKFGSPKSAFIYLRERY